MSPHDPATFKQLLANCASEPIQYPGAIQPHGVLLTLSEPDLKLLQVSANIETLFGLQPAQVLGQPLACLLGQAQAASIALACATESWVDAPPLLIDVRDHAFEALLHRHQGVLVLELERQDLPVMPVDDKVASRHLGRILRNLQAAQSLPALYEACVQGIQRLTGYDRVLIYRFEAQGHGQVIADGADHPALHQHIGIAQRALCGGGVDGGAADQHLLAECGQCKRGHDHCSDRAQTWAYSGCAAHRATSWPSMKSDTGCNVRSWRS